MTKQILITGGAGFIGSHLADELIANGYSVRVLDNLSEQVHGPDGNRPSYLNSEVELQIGDVRDRAAVDNALKNVDAVFHLAAMVGVGQSMYEIDRYVSANNYGTSVLLQALINHPVKRLIVASSMSIYGEGRYRDSENRDVSGVERSIDQLKRGDWEIKNGTGEPLQALPTPESKHPALASIYALSKYDQERMCLLFGRAYNVPTVALRFFNVYGTRQSLSNPYTGVLAIFAARLLNNNPPLIFEDGLQRRDFVSVKDVARACRLALERTDVDAEVFNIGSGQSYTVLDIADRLATALDKKQIKGQLTHDCRVGDIRHCFADISLARERLGYDPQVTLEQGINDLSEWLIQQVAVDHVAEHHADLTARGLTMTRTNGQRAGSNGSRNGKQNSIVIPKGRASDHVKPNRILITGGAGFIGSNVAHRLAMLGQRVLIFDRLSRPGVEKNLKWLTALHGNLIDVEIADVRTPSQIQSAVRDATQVFHFAAQVAVTSSLDDPIDDFEINARGTLNLLEAIRALPTRPGLIFTSTNKVYGGLPDVRIVRQGSRYMPADPMLASQGVSEDRPLDFCSPYGCSKGAADQYVLDYARTYRLPAVVFRMSCIYGPRQFGNEDQGWLAHFIIQSIARKPITIYGDGMQVRDVLFIDDLVDAFFAAQTDIHRVAGNAFNIGGGPANTISLLELLELLHEFHCDTAIEFQPWRAADQRYYVSNTSKFHAATGWQPRIGIREGVKRLYDYLRGQEAQAVPSEALRPVPILTPTTSTIVST